MSRLAICMAEGCEEIEGLTVVDLLRRSNVTIDMISITGELQVKGSHGITFLADRLISDTELSDYDGIILPGGIPGTPNLGMCEAVTQAIREFAQQNKLVAAICAAPSVLGQCGVLEGKRATSYPGFDKDMPGCDYREDRVVVDGNVITSRGMGTAIEFGLAILSYIKDEKTAEDLAEKIMF